MGLRVVHKSSMTTSDQLYISKACPNEGGKKEWKKKRHREKCYGIQTRSWLTWYIWSVSAFKSTIRIKTGLDFAVKRCVNSSPLNNRKNYRCRPKPHHHLYKTVYLEQLNWVWQFQFCESCDILIIEQLKSV